MGRELRYCEITMNIFLVTGREKICSDDGQWVCDQKGKYVLREFAIVCIKHKQQGPIW
jgi:hypothetical protein